VERQELISKLLDLLADGGHEECPICMEDISQPVITSCGHLYCRGCIENWMINETAVCPLCRGVISKASLVDAPEGDVAMKESDTKVVCSFFCLAITPLL
jgi:SWI/SNF-related matrix-associated actin-dependent regulator of chromatin subfamily A3